MGHDPFGAHELRTDFRGFDVLGSLHAQLSQHQNQRIGIDCSKLFWIDGHLAAPLMTVISQARLRNNNITLQNLPDDVKLILKKNGLLLNRAVDSYRTTIPVQLFGLDEEVIFADYTRRHLRRKEMPKMTPALLGKIFEGIDELFANCALHSRSPVKVVATGQFFPRGERLAFAISDGGRGVDGSLKAAGIAYRSPEDAIDWAMQSNNTSRQGDIPGGLGLKLLRDFIELNGGSLLVTSNGGVWRQSGSQVQKSRLRNPFPGTSVVFEIKTDDEHVYDLKSSPDPRDIW
ncbi:ATP-binding protein [Rhizobium leguminosarum]|uniref:ATP-binding protein n=1 Tax=Rhizobium leguminosarum TaxID=384 RepID=UPI00102F3B6C|nr:ATP-binding protein [Rhizobium leguminosarum]TAV53080.1 ATP-binding protein [Rhizobium leguminosarum]